MSADVTLDFNSQAALNALTEFNRLKGNDSVCNLANLKMDPSTAGRDCLTQDLTKNNVARFAATFFTFGLCQKYRKENKATALKVQQYVNAAIQQLKTTITKDNAENDPSKQLPFEARKQIEVAIKDFEKIVFQSRTTILPPPFLARFYYWVLGLNNTQFKERIVLSFNRENTGVAAVDNAVKSITQPVRVPERDEKELKALAAAPFPQTPLLLQSSTSSVSSPQLQLQSSASSSSSSPTALVPVSAERRFAAKPKPLTPLQASYVALQRATFVARDAVTSDKAGCDSVSDYAANVARINEAQSAAVNKNPGLTIQQWKTIDLEFAQVAFENGFLPQDAKLIIEEYYKFISDLPDPAKARREAEKAMNALNEEVTNAFYLELMGMISMGELPEPLFQKLMVHVKQVGEHAERLGDQIGEQLFAENADTLTRGIVSAASADLSKNLTQIMFKMVSERILRKIEEKYPGALEGSQKPIIQYKMLMMGLKTFGFVTATRDLASKVTLNSWKFRVASIVIPAAIEQAIHSCFAKTPNEINFTKALEKYMASIQTEQDVNKAMMQLLVKNPSTSADKLAAEYAKATQKAEADQKSDHSKQVVSVFGAVKSLKDMQNLTPLMNINDLGYANVSSETMQQPMVVSAQQEFQSQLATVAGPFFGNLIGRVIVAVVFEDTPLRLVAPGASNLRLLQTPEDATGGSASSSSSSSSS